jgi:hypothetical protein
MLEINNLAGGPIWVKRASYGWQAKYAESWGGWDRKKRPAHDEHILLYNFIKELVTAKVFSNEWGSATGPDESYSGYFMIGRWNFTTLYTHWAKVINSLKIHAKGEAARGKPYRVVQARLGCDFAALFLRFLTKLTDVEFCELFHDMIQEVPVAAYSVLVPFMIYFVRNDSQMERLQKCHDNMCIFGRRTLSRHRALMAKSAFHAPTANTYWSLSPPMPDLIKIFERFIPTLMIAIIRSTHPMENPETHQSLDNALVRVEQGGSITFTTSEYEVINIVSGASAPMGSSLVCFRSTMHTETYRWARDSDHIKAATRALAEQELITLQATVTDFSKRKVVKTGTVISFE